MKSWNITVEQFQEASPYYKKAVEAKETEEALNNWMVVIAIVTDTTVDVIQEMPFDKLKEKIKELAWLGTLPPDSPKFKIEINGIKYKAPKDEKEFNTSSYIEYKTFLKGGAIENLHLLLATLYRPEEKQSHKERAEIFKKVMIGEVYGMVFFWTKRYKKRIARIKSYGLKVAQKKNKEAQKILMETLRETLENIGDGTPPLTK